jgi:hypothetical protein
MGLVRRGYLSISEAYEKIFATLEPHPRPSPHVARQFDYGAPTHRTRAFSIHVASYPAAAR